MLFFKCRISFNELVSLEKHLPEDMYCISRDDFQDFHFGVIRSAIFSKLLNVLSGETLEQLEYLNEEEFRQAVSAIKNKKIKFVGNTELLLE